MKRGLKCFALMAAVLLLFVVGCQKAQEKAAEKSAEKTIEKQTGKKTKVDINEQKTTIEQKGMKAEIAHKGSVSLPEDFPKDVYIYPGSRVVMSFTTKEGTSVTLGTNDDLASVASKYASEMANKGWSKEGSMAAQEMRIMGFAKGNRKVTVQIMPGSDEDKTLISIASQTEE